MWQRIIIGMAVLGVILAATLSISSNRTQAIPPLVKQPPVNPFKHSIAGAGVVEPASENIVIGVNEPGRIAKVFVHQGQKVNAGDPLMQTDISSLEAQRVAAVASIETAEASLKRVQAYRRPEDEANLRAKLAQARAQRVEAEDGVSEAVLAAAEQDWLVQDQADQTSRLEKTVAASASSEQEYAHAKFTLGLQKARLDSLKQKVISAKSKIETAIAGVQVAEADLKTYLAGPWKADVETAQAAVAEAKAKVKQLDMEIERRTVGAPIDAVVLRCEAIIGQYAMANNPDPENAGIVIGNLTDLNVRVDIDELDAQRFREGMPAAALFKTGDGTSMALEFVRIDPFVIPKRALTNSQTELVDTRVLQVIYKVRDTKAKLYIGQQLDVYIEVSAGMPTR